MSLNVMKHLWSKVTKVVKRIKVQLAQGDAKLTFEMVLSVKFECGGCKFEENFMCVN
jgi:hypothetical protein